MGIPMLPWHEDDDFCVAIEPMLLDPARVEAAWRLPGAGSGSPAWTGPHAAWIMRSVARPRKASPVDYFEEQSEDLPVLSNLLASLRPGGRAKGHSRWIYIAFPVRVYSAQELAAAFRSAGFSAAEIFGDFDGQPYDREGKYLIAVGTK